MTKKILSIFVIVMFLNAFMGVILYNAKAGDVPQKLNKGKWAPNTRQSIDNLIKKNAGKEGSYAVFDWDNTCIYPDTEENLLVYQMEHLAFKMTPDEFKYAFTHYIDTGKEDNIEIPTGNFVAAYNNVDGKPINITMIAEDCYNDYKFFYENYKGMNPNASGNKSLDEMRETDQFKDFKAKMWFTYSALYGSFVINVSYTWIM